MSLNYLKHSLILIYLLAFSITTRFAIATSPVNQCVLDIEFSSDVKGADCMSGDWNGFPNNECCSRPFKEYLQALAHWTNRTGKLFLNSDQQKDCISSLKSTDGHTLSCGIEKLTSGSGGCSDYYVTDVVNNLGDRLRNLNDDCKLLVPSAESPSHCSPCVMRWEEMGDISINGTALTKLEADVCRFSVLLALTSQRINDENSRLAVYSCLGESSLSADDQESPGVKTKKIHTGLYVLIAGLACVAVVVASASWILYRKATKGKLIMLGEASRVSSFEESRLNISLREVYSATNNLSPSNFIGQGIAGKVYSGVLSNGQHVAIKHIINDGQMETFVREVTSMSHVKHPNLVSLIGHCEGRDECFLVYELCHKGNLSEWLFGKDKFLSWIRRLDIAHDCARGLWFLHSYPEGCIVHRDIKPTNILICADFQAKLSDFGLSKVLNIDQSYVSSEVRGTFGYMDPEYLKNRRVNSKGDVYSFGIVLLQLLSGQRVINIDSNRPMPLDRMAKLLTRGSNVTEFADPKLNGEYPVEAFELVFKLALLCTGLKQQRPSMEEVIIRLERAFEVSTELISANSHSVSGLYLAREGS